MSAILSLGDPRLRLRSVAVAPEDPQLHHELRDLANALQSFRATYGWGRAVALPQLGIAKRVIAVDLGGGPFFLLNPEIQWISPETFELWDDCMCMPSIAVKVRRARSLTVTFVDASMKPGCLERVSPDLSELLQHELDHLDGILFTDRMMPEWGVIARELRHIARPINSPEIGISSGTISSVPL